jgi:acetyltransferase-like isoleucine patch superfamily enzyme
VGEGSLTVGIDFQCHEDVFMKHFAKCTFGNHVAIDKGFYSTVIMEIGDYVHIPPYCSVVGGANCTFKMGEFSCLTAGVRIICQGDDFANGYMSNPQVPLKYRNMQNGPGKGVVTIGRFAAVGTNAVIMPGLTIAEGSVIGAGAVVTKSTEPWTVYVGTPARPVKIRPRELILKGARELGYPQFDPAYQAFDEAMRILH